MRRRDWSFLDCSQLQFLRRPPMTEQKWRLDQVIKRAAERGVQIYVVVYKEVDTSSDASHATKAKQI